MFIFLMKTLFMKTEGKEMLMITGTEMICSGCQLGIIKAPPRRLGSRRYPIVVNPILGAPNPTQLPAQILPRKFVARSQQGNDGEPPHGFPLEGLDHGLPLRPTVALSELRRWCWFLRGRDTRAATAAPCVVRVRGTQNRDFQHTSRGRIVIVGNFLLLGRNMRFWRLHLWGFPCFSSALCVIH